MGAIHKMLYGWGFTQFGVRLLSELDPGSPEWFAFAEPLIQGKDLDTRSLLLDQLKEAGFYDGNPEKERIKNMALEYLKAGVGDEKRTAMQFFRENRGAFSKETADVFSAMYAATRSHDKKLAENAEDLLKGWGWDRDAIKSDKELR